MGSALSLPADMGEDLTITHIISRESIPKGTQD
jgi:hypothetical protein